MREAGTTVSYERMKNQGKCYTDVTDSQNANETITFTNSLLGKPNPIIFTFNEFERVSCKGCHVMHVYKVINNHF